MRGSERITEIIVANRRVTLAVLLVLLVTVGAGSAMVEEELTLQEFETGSEAEQKLAFVEENFETSSENETIVQLFVRGENVFEKETLIGTLELQRDLRANDSVAGTISEERSTTGIANVVARAAISSERPDIDDPTLDQQIVVLESMSQSQIDAVLADVFDGPHSSDALVFVPTNYESDTTTAETGESEIRAANATMIVAFQTVESRAETGQAPPEIVDAQLAMAALVDEQFPMAETAIVGNGLVTHEMGQSMDDTWAILGPAALLLVLSILAIAYRDVVDVILSLFGIVLVQIWTFGMLGWLGVAFNPVLIAVPVLLIGLSIDYCLHVFMRYRENRTGNGEGISAAMSAGLAGVGMALLWVTLTTAIGFLSNLVSPVQPVREIGLIAAIGIIGAFVIFGLFVPLLKVELEILLERCGLDRVKPPIGTDGGALSSLLSVGATAARKAPVLLVVTTLLITTGAAVVATDVSTSWGPEDHIVEDAPAWTQQLPASLEPGEYTVREDMRYANAHFTSPDSQVEILIEGAVTDATTLERLDRARSKAATRDVIVTLANGDARTEDPLTVMERAATTDEEFAETFHSADTTGDGIPDENVEAVYDALFATAPDEASSVIYREDGEYEALRMSVSVNPEADGTATTEQLHAVAGTIDGDGTTATATGDPIVEQLIQHHLLETLLTSLLLTICAVLVVLALVYRVVHGSATLGAVTLLPVVFTVAWIVATMHAFGYPLTVLNVIIASLTIGIGIDYSIHVTERFREELDETVDVHEALEMTVRGTGGALLGSAATTAVGFGVLGFAVHPMLQQFGLLTAIMIVYAFLGAVFVLPSLLMFWARYLEPEATGILAGTAESDEKTSPGD